MRETECHIVPVHHVHLSEQSDPEIYLDVACALSKQPTNKSPYHHPALHSGAVTVGSGHIRWQACG